MQVKDKQDENRSESLIISINVDKKSAFCLNYFIIHGP